jgi:hypothetical protein
MATTPPYGTLHLLDTVANLVHGTDEGHPARPDITAQRVNATELHITVAGEGVPERTYTLGITNIETGCADGQD